MYNHKYECLFDGSNVVLDVKAMSCFVDGTTRRGYYLIKTPSTLGGDAYIAYFDEEDLND